MATKKRTGNKQPAADPALKQAVKEEAKEAEAEATTAIEPPVVSINADLDPDELHLHDSRS